MGNWLPPKQINYLLPTCGLPNIWLLATTLLSGVSVSVFGRTMPFSCWFLFRAQYHTSAFSFQHRYISNIHFLDCVRIEMLDRPFAFKTKSPENSLTTPLSTSLCYGTVEALPVFMLFFGPDIDLFQSFTIQLVQLNRRGGVAKQ